ncbi:GNAT family N-acetyltransferase [Arthrobacter sp. R4-81]
MTITLRRYESRDAAATQDIFYRAVHVTASSSYSPEQIAVWAPEDIDVESWGRKQTTRNGVVAEVDGEVAGFSDVDAQGYIDMMFVAPEHGRTGVGTALMSSIFVEASRRGANSLSTNASEAAKKFFEKQGFTVGEHRRILRDGVILTNYAMSRQLS